MTDIWGGATSPKTTDRVQLRPSPVFLGILAVFAFSGWALWSGSVLGRFAVFLFVLSGWLLSLCLHEYAHAVVAYRGGDRSVAAAGYLTLDPFKYSHALYSIVLPLIFVLLGGIGLPGGAVLINRAALRSRVRESLVSAAGPLVNVLFAVAVLLPVAAIGPTDPDHLTFWAGLSFLGFLQVTASVLNLLPVPGLDGFGILDPWLPQSWAPVARTISMFSLFGVLILLWVPAINRAFFDLVFLFLEPFGIPVQLVGFGHGLFQFWT